MGWDAHKGHLLRRTRILLSVSIFRWFRATSLTSQVREFIDRRLMALDCCRWLCLCENKWFVLLMMGSGNETMKKIDQKKGDEIDKKANFHHVWALFYLHLLCFARTLRCKLPFFKFLWKTVAFVWLQPLFSAAFSCKTFEGGKFMLPYSARRVTGGSPPTIKKEGERKSGWGQDEVLVSGSSGHGPGTLSASLFPLIIWQHRKAP